MTNGLLWAGLGGELELRQDANGAKRLSGSFPYRKRAVLSDGGRRGRPQKEEFDERAFAYRVEDPQAEIHFLVGHSYDRPLARKLDGTLRLRDTPLALLFEAFIARELAEVSHVRDALALISAGLATGVSPGFRLPPERAVPREEAEEITEEPDNPEEGEHRAIIRKIKQALLFELSLVTAPAYPEAQVEARNWSPTIATPRARSYLRRWRL
ncbi:MAG: HK97 family phage prohead protease [Amphiplicatus sp.]